MNFPTTKIIFDRKKDATNKKKAIVQIEVYFSGKRKYISTGIKLFANQWNKGHVVNCLDLIEYNERINAVKANIDSYISEQIRQRKPFSWTDFSLFIDATTKEKETFVEYVERRINERKDIRDSSKKTQRKLITALNEFKKIVYFDDLKKANIKMFDDYLKNKGIKQTTVYSYHKTLKTYIHDAMAYNLIKADPYVGMKLDKGRSEDGRWLTADEVGIIERRKVVGQTIEHVKDLFLLQCYTGLAFGDLYSLSLQNVENYEKYKLLKIKRKKTNVTSVIFILPEVEAILNKYNDTLPTISNQKYNVNLKILMAQCDIQKNIASHWGRRTCGMLLLNKGFKIEIVSKVLGHTSIRTTEQCYAKILDSSVVNAFKDAFNL